MIRDELPLLNKSRPNLVSILIGVNDLVQGRTTDQYRGSLRSIYDAVAELHLSRGHVVAISIPNWSVVPAARDFGDPSDLHRLTDAFNAIAQKEAKSRDFGWVDTTDVSTSQTGTRGWISSDRLHPGDPQYAAWAEVIIRGTWFAELINSRPADA